MISVTESVAVQRFIDDYLRNLEEGNASVFAGAGLSVPAGIVDWRSLMRGIATDLGLAVEEEHDLVAVAQFYANKHGNRSELNRAILDGIASGRGPTESHRLLAELPITAYWTTNYDNLIETALGSAGKVVDVKHDVNQLAFTAPRRDAVVYKMHGDASHPAEAVLTKDDYERFGTRRHAFTTALAGDLVEKTFLFLGFSFADPNLDYVLARVRATFATNQRQHYCIMKIRAREPGEENDVFQRALIRQELAIEDLKRFNINTIVVDDYSTVPKLLDRIVRQHKRRTVFVSGSAAEFGSWTREQVETFLSRLGAVLLQQGFRVVTGMGQGVGDSLLAGAVGQVYADRKGHLEDLIEMRPFPQWDPSAVGKSRWERYRTEMISKAGISLFLFGNKLDGSTIVPADGVVTEFEISMAQGIAVVPVGGTGYVAGDLWTRMSSDFKKYFPQASAALEPAFAELGAARGDPTELIEPILLVLRTLSKE
jgi:hypothetical protein